ncbi:methyltransferase domain-containing protein [Candidatus Woesearchaeota archaeon]|nr:methyltransferase domain-containing protein [Candidatus Woesearchaeota archaeon]MBW3021394.1 methyltransferase domain-containing protein [Candidatus Woesearchaeota archaeon]
MENYFGMEIPEISAILKDPKICDFIGRTLSEVLRHLHIHSPDYVTATILEMAGKRGYEAEANEVLQKKGVQSRLAHTLDDRARIMFHQIRQHVKGKSVLDIGCGDGRLAKMLADDNLDVTAIDVYEHPNVLTTGLDFHEFEQGEDIPLDSHYDTTLLLTVLHHSSDPLHTLREARRLTKDRLIIIESVYGITNDSYYGSLTPEEQRMVNVFFDHFYNWIIHYSKDPDKKVNIPFNFRTPKQWHKIFEHCGFNVVEERDLGIDQPSVPEHHRFYALDISR